VANQNYPTGFLGLVAFLVTLLTLFVTFLRGKSILKVKDYPTSIQHMFMLVSKVFTNRTTAQIVTAQALLETDRLRSRIYRTKNNAFGIGGDGDLAWKFDNVQDSVEWLKDFLVRKGIGANFTNPETYARKLKGIGYYTAPTQQYSDLLRYLFEEVKKATNETSQVDAVSV